MDGTSSDGEVLRAVARGDRAAFALLYERHAGWLLLRLRHRCADAQLVEDVVQETFLAVWHGADRYREQSGADVAGWLWRIGQRRLVDALRRTGARDRLWRVLRGRPSKDEPSAEDQVLLGVEHGDLGAALDRLPPELRAVLQATVLDGLTTREAAALLGVPPGTVKTRAMRARRELRSRFS
ncbi:RNA polymerase sigma-70 factor (ECF subfamily) [Kribbella amoyensis]|uniref:RNA polymerase sigma-70 factor (ECF subfamily) n=1 Tax=Kribbella amoyensis TaxID=996641 RepID=A0A561BPL4_9ACTN|nr:RNA polymerase sigma factor [Kribbella amoyensis]TWD80806.1 RNA polymerase sigma-70 factor (ECF subfamily) [Kribbella amoyensis]